MIQDVNEVLSAHAASGLSEPRFAEGLSDILPELQAHRVSGPANDSFDAADHIGYLNNLLQECARRPGGVELVELLEVLHRCLPVIASGLFLRPAKSGRSCWAVLAEMAIEDGPRAPDPDSDCGAPRYHASAGTIEVCLRALYSERVNRRWEDEVCRLVASLAAVNRSCARSTVARTNSRPASPVQRHDVWCGIVGKQIRSLLSQFEDECLYADAVLILGETGTGKEFAAQGAHRLWDRSGPFVAVNCAAVPADLLDAELFGIEAGTATGVSARKGRLEQADGGTLFLDEISELPIQLQSKFLRVLQERSYFKLGGSALRSVDVKIVAASNRPDRDLRGGHMRLDLYYRLAQTVIPLPPLRERKHDIPAICEHFLDELENKHHRGVTGLSRHALDRLKNYSWPGNIRELQNVLRRLYAQARAGGPIHNVELLPPEVAEPTPQPGAGPLHAILDRVQRDVLKRELDRTSSVAGAARALGISESYLHRLIKKLGL